MVELYIVRHAQSECNEIGVIAGRLDCNLSEKGKRQAGLLAKRLEGERFHKVYCSPLKRCLQTLQPYLDENKTEVQTEEGLIELNLGIYEGRSSAEMVKTDENYRFFREHTGLFKAEEGESVKEAGVRLKHTLEKICKENEGKRLLICTHGAATMAFYCEIGLFSYEEIKLHGHGGVVPNASLSIINYEDGKFSVKSRGENGYLLNEATYFTVV